MRYILVFFILFFSFHCVGQNYSRKDFTAYAISKVSPELWYKMNTSINSFSISVVAGHLQIFKAISARNREYTVETGKLLPLDIGELGGGLYYKPNDATKDTFFVNGKKVIANSQLSNFKIFLLKNDPKIALIKGKHVLLEGGNMQAVMSYDNDWLFIYNFTNMQGVHGLLSKLTIKKDSFTVKNIFDLAATTEAMTIHNRQIFIITDHGFYNINADGKEWTKELVFDNPLFVKLKANSIAAINKRNIYVGLNGGYAKINLIKKNIKLFVYDKVK